MLRKRWRQGAGAERAAAVLERLRQGSPLDDLGLDEYEGRIDLRGLALPTPDSVRLHAAGGTTFEEKAGFFEVSDVRWEGLDLSHAVLDSLRAAGLRASDCRFAEASLRRVRLWAAEIESCSFEGADLRESGLGAWSPDRGGNRFAASSFRDADLRALNCSAATFEDCDFSDARLDKAEFGASRFERCRFAGPLREVIFARTALVNTGNGSERVDLGNELRDCDFRDAVLFWCDFRQLDLQSITLPVDPDLIVVEHYRCVLGRLLPKFDAERTPAALALRGKMRHDQKWLHPQREVGLIHRSELREAGSEEVVADAERVLREAESLCAAGDGSGGGSGGGSGLRRLVRRKSA
jgi:uncharacterized protein YjbI with pentapeptide repeats